MRPARKPKIGVFVCHCGRNIASVVDVPEVVRRAAELPGVAHAAEYKYMCSQPGQDMVCEAIRREGLDRVVVAACSPSLHEGTFRKAAAVADLNPYQVEMANIREQCAWVHQHNGASATDKAAEIVASMVAKASGDRALESGKVPVTRRALVVGAGVAGIQAALDIADAGYEVVLVEKEPSIGGHMAQLSETFPTLDCAQCILTPKMVSAGSHPNIRLMPWSEVREVSGFVGNFRVTVERKVSGIDFDKCTGCGVCVEKCPVRVPAEFDSGLGTRKAVYTPFPQAVPNKPVIDREHCLKYLKDRCGLCQKVCEAGAVDYHAEPRLEEIEVGAIVVATGFDLYPVERLGEYGGGKIPDVIDALAFERLLSASGPTAGQIRRPSDGKTPKNVVFIQCAGSRDPENHRPYCSRICCMYATKQAMLYQHAVHGGQTYIFYIDIRSGGKNYEEFVERAQDEGVVYIRGKVARVFQAGEKVAVMGVDTLAGQPVRIDADLVVLSTAMVPRASSEGLRKVLKIAADANGFWMEAHPKMNPVGSNTEGIFLAGCGQAPRDVPDTVAQASGAAGRVVGLFARGELSLDPVVVEVVEDLCSGCGMCVAACAYDARALDEVLRTATVNEALCKGCGACMTACSNGATVHRNFSRDQVMRMIGSFV